MNSTTDTGFTLARQVLGLEECAAWIEVLGTIVSPGRRGLMATPEVSAWARSERLLRLVRPFLTEEPRPVRAIYFDKSPEANWLVPWHQDLTLALRQRAEVPGFGPWSVKDGIPHVQPPITALERMMTIRIHLDDADASNGALRVLPATHQFWRLDATRIQSLRSERTEVLCEVKAGDAVLMRPLLLHASSRSTSPRHRRVLHIEYAGFELPAPLEWNDAA